MRVPRLILAAAAPLALAALLGSPAPAGAAIGKNSLSQNGLMFNGVAPNSVTFNSLVSNALSANSLTQNALAPAGTSLEQLDGVQVEAVTLPDAAE